SPNRDLLHRIPLERVAVVARPHLGLLASKLGRKASTNLGAPHPDKDSVQPHRFLLKGCEIEACPGILDLVRDRGSDMARRLQRDIGTLLRVYRQRCPKHSFPEGGRIRQRLQWQARDLTALRDPDVIPVQLHCAERPPKGVKEETKEGALLQSNQ
ncbi:hypothetical protein, partial [Neotabrizicola sp. VNH66]|uniref:hypothetical protein n=1 Tax=Neotabrizicola sp. VNH66 TaxID=3400918 RepID=UPI003C0148DA